MERETLSNHAEYQEILREARIKALLGDRANKAELMMLLEINRENRQMRLQVSIIVTCTGQMFLGEMSYLLD